MGKGVVISQRIRKRSGVVASISIALSLSSLLYLVCVHPGVADASMPDDGAEYRGPHRLPDINRRFPSRSFHDSFSVLWGAPRIFRHGSSVQLKLDQRSGGGGFMSKEEYMYGYFSAAIKLPARNSTAGIVVAFYTSNAGRYPNNHDELDFEFLGNLPGEEWALQTNIYGNGSTQRGREERFNLWFDPSANYHHYAILWNHKHIVFLVDNIPIRRLIRTKVLGVEYPSKPMSLYATIWDGSSWATGNGKYPVDYKYSPFIATFKDLKIEGCSINPASIDAIGDISDASSSLNSKCLDRDQMSSTTRIINHELQSLRPNQLEVLQQIHSKYVFYSYCKHHDRYPIPPPDCNDNIIPPKDLDNDLHNSI